MWNLSGSNREYFYKTVCYTKANEPSLPYDFNFAGGRIAGVIPFSRMLTLCEMQAPSCRLELVSPSLFPSTITITSAHPYVYTIIRFKVNILL